VIQSEVPLKRLRYPESCERKGPTAMMYSFRVYCLQVIFRTPYAGVNLLTPYSGVSLLAEGLIIGLSM